MEAVRLWSRQTSSPGFVSSLNSIFKKNNNNYIFHKASNDDDAHKNG